MPRNLTYSALTLRVVPSGESNRDAWFLSAEEGVIRATVFGGPKSRLRARVAPYHEGTLWVYHDPVRDSRKVSDFDARSYRTGLRELYERVTAAGAVAETVLASHGGGGNWPEALKLAGGVLDALEGADAAACSRLGVSFLWRWAELLGARPDISVCASCACEAARDEVLWYSQAGEALYCEDCARRSGVLDRGDAPASLRAGPGARLWLAAIAGAPSAGAARITADAASLEQAGRLSKAVLAAALGRRLPTWDGI